jgi:hypothetical protein
VLLLLILALLSMFGLIAVAFVVISGQAKRSAKSVERIEQVSDPAPKLLQQAAMQVFRGSTSPASVMGPHSLLEDMYGTETVTGSITAVPTPNPDVLQLTTNIPIAAALRGQGGLLTITGPAIPTMSNWYGCTTSVLNVVDPGTGLAKISVSAKPFNGTVALGTETFVLSVRTRGTLAADAVYAGGGNLHQLLDITIAGLTSDQILRSRGRVMTIIGPSTATAGYGQSTRIVDSNPATNTIQVVAFPDGAIPLTGATFFINNSPFSGTGFGYESNPASPNVGTLNAAFPLAAVLTPAQIVAILNGGAPQTWPLALLPRDPLNLNPAGGANEDYDAADYQNMLLSAQVYNGGVVSTLPSFHRTALVNYWYHWLYANVNWSSLSLSAPADIWKFILHPYDNDYKTIPLTGTNKRLVADLILAIKRKILMRPLMEDHPNFDGSNPTSRYILPPATLWNGTDVNQFWERGDLALLNGQWDVDNDGDGVQDSVWVDLGMPVRSTSDGRLYKPLFAILCTDLDGRLNLNAHGCVAQAAAGTYNAAGAYDAVTAPTGTTFAGGGNANLPRGLGYGPAEISIWPILQNAVGGGTLTTANRLTIYDTLLDASGTSAGRYPVVSATSPGWLGGNAAHRLNANNWFLLGDSYSGVLSAYGSPPDLSGGAAIGLDWGGRPLYPGISNVLDAAAAPVSLAGQCPYEQDLTNNRLKGAPNTPFGVAELERLLRPYDRDATALPSRLATGLADIADFYRRKCVTTESWDVPTAGSVLPDDLRQVMVDRINNPTVLPDNLQTLLGLDRTSPGRLEDLLKARLARTLYTGGTLDDTQAATMAGQVRTMVTELLPPEILAGRKMDLNRAFGDGRDENGAAANNVVDEPGETNTLSQYTLDTQTQSTKKSQTLTVYDPTGTATSFLVARQLYARYLYVLAMLLVDQPSLLQSQQLTAITAPTPPTADDAARFLAQWAVNTVDYYDADSIMTPFVYNPDPFTATGWNETTYHTGLPAAGDTTVVWGCERPELLITETLAFHDRRTQDTSAETTVAVGEDTQTGPGTTTDGSNDASFDQRYVPEGSLFVELYNPWSTGEHSPGELCDSPPTGVDLGKTTSTTLSRISPVWRLAISRGADATTDPDDPPDPATFLMRTVYFTGSSVSLTQVDDEEKGLDNLSANRRFHPNDAMALKIGPILPGRYAVIGPGKPDDEAVSTTYLGFKHDQHPGSCDADTRRIELQPGETTNQVRIFDSEGTGPTNDLTSVHRNEPTAIVIGEPRRLNISEPNDGYTLAAGTVADWPLDLNPATALNETAIHDAIWKNERTDGVAVVHLQRLANPLLPFDSVSNPYRTIDSMPIDLTAFNGVDPSDDPSVTHAVATPIPFFARQRGANVSEPLASGNALWLQESMTNLANTDATFTASAAKAPESHAPWSFTASLKHTLSFLNSTYGTPGDGTTSPIGDPSTTAFPWLNWNNRPFINASELLYVPWAKSSRLCYDYGIAFAAPNPYHDSIAEASSPYLRLLSFFQSPVAGDQGCQLDRILDYVGVPSRFVGTQIQIDPTVANVAGSNFRPPFNCIPTYREPGKINLNTIYDQAVFTGLLNGRATPTWDDFGKSRRNAPGAYVAGAVQPLAMVANDCPTVFPFPFRSSGAGHMVPTLVPDTLTPNREVNATVLREGATAGHPLFEATTANLYDDAARNPYFRYEGIQRLANLTTTRSNVYAIWITVGYFEVTPAPAGYNTQIYPDGYQLGRELGIDTGEVERHRAFYIFDRSLPVGFQRGEDANVEKAILVNRYIE